MKNLIETVVLAVPLLAAAPAMADDVIINPGGPTWQPTISAIALKVPVDPTWRISNGRAAGYDADDPEECNEDAGDNCVRIIDPTLKPTISVMALKTPADPTWKPVDAVHAPGDPTWRSAAGRAAGYDADDPEECDEDIGENCGRVTDPTL